MVVSYLYVRFSSVWREEARKVVVDGRCLYLEEI